MTDKKPKRLRDHLEDLTKALSGWSKRDWTGDEWKAADWQGGSETGSFQPAPDWRGRLSGVLQKSYNSVKGVGGETLTKSAKALEEAIPFLERAGYDVTLIEVGVGFSPKVSAHLRFREAISEQERSDILADAGDRAMVMTILNALFSAASAREKLSFSNFHFTHIELELSILPTVILKFLPDTEDQRFIEYDEVGLLE